MLIHLQRNTFSLSHHQRKYDWHIMLYLALGHTEPWLRLPPFFSPFQLVNGVESILPIECEIPSLILAVVLLLETFDPEQCLVHLESLDEQCQDVSMTIEENKRCVKVQYDNFVCPR
jgi:hypothetical protein